MAKRVVVFKESESELTKPETAVELATATNALRALRPLGIRFATEHVDGDATTVTAWLEEKEPKAKRERRALGAAVAPQGSPDGEGAE